MPESLTSLDGVEWAIEEVTNGLSVNQTNTSFFGVGGNTNILLAVGTSGSMAFSLNNEYTVVTTNDDGSLSTNTISDLGIQWQNLPALNTNNDLQNRIQLGHQLLRDWRRRGNLLQRRAHKPRKLAVGNQRHHQLPLRHADAFFKFPVCVGNTGTTRPSPDGVTWTKHTSGTTNWLFRVHNCNGTLIAVGENGTILTSTNSINWTSRHSGTSNWLNDVVMITNEYFVVGDLGTLLTSTNATTWTGAPIITDQSLYGAACMNGQLVVAGVEGIILRNQIVPDLSPLEFIAYSIVTNQCFFEVGTTDGNTDVTFTLDTTSDLTNWTTGPKINITDDSGTTLFSTPVPTNSGLYYRATLVP